MTTVVKGVHPASEGVWRVLATTVGPTFSHNTFVMAARKAGVGREQARRDFRVLSQRYNGQEPQEEATVTQTTTRETAVPALVETVDVSELDALRRQVQQLHEIVQRLEDSDVLPRLAKLEGREVPALRSALQALEVQQQAAKVAWEADEAPRAFLRQGYQLAKTDAEVQESLLGWLWQISGNRPRAALMRWFLKAFGWKEPDNLWQRPQ